jgi:hypothetical protein
VVKFVVLPDAKGSNPGGHFFTDNDKTPLGGHRQVAADQHLLGSRAWLGLRSHSDDLEYCARLSLLRLMSLTS